jgi:murein DD-endopeptidase MepM/ murein hydrolase activator NlpD
VVEIIHNNKIKTRYAHLMNSVVKEGDRVKRGSIIGKTGMSGRTTGPHLHYEVIVNEKKENPLKYILPGKITY